MRPSTENPSVPSSQGIPTSNTDVRLRALEPEDLELLYAIENEMTLWQHAATTVPYSRYVLRQYIAEAKYDLFQDGEVRLVAEANGTPLALCDLTHFDPQHQRAEVGIVVLPQSLHQGHGQRALKALEEYAHRLMLHQLYAIVADDNNPAIRLFRQRGFVPSTPLKDWIKRSNQYVSATVWQKILSTDNSSFC